MWGTIVSIGASVAQKAGLFSGTKTDMSAEKGIAELETELAQYRQAQNTGSGSISSILPFLIGAAGGLVILLIIIFK